MKYAFNEFMEQKYAEAEEYACGVTSGEEQIAREAWEEATRIEREDKTDRLNLALKTAYCQKVGADDPTGLDCCSDYCDWLKTLTPNVE